MGIGGGRRAAILLSGLAVLGGSGGASADEPPPSPPSPLVVTVTPGTSEGAPWNLRVENTGDLPVRLAADIRLLSLELMPPAGTTTKKGASRPVRCTLPASARPQTDEGHELVVPGKRAWATTFDPLYLCFDAPARAALVPGREVRAHFGFAPPARAPKTPTGPFVAAPVGAAVGTVPAVKELLAAPFTIPETTAAKTAAPDAPAAATPPAPPPPLKVTATPSVDAASGKDLAITVTVQNRSDRTLVSFVRPSTLRFRVDGPRGPVACGNAGEPPAIRELFATLAPKRSIASTVRLDAYCPPDTFDEAGIYRVRAILDTSNASGASLGLKTWDDVAEAETDALVRIRLPRRPGGPRPTLE